MRFCGRVIWTKIVNLEYALCQKADVWPTVNRLTKDPVVRLI
jgi:hypothetical protein